MTPNNQFDNRYDETALKPLVVTIYRNRQRVAAVVAVVMLLFAIGAIAVLFRAPVERTATVAFRPLFSQADSGQYPNGTPFSSADILATPVINHVFDVNELERFGSFHEFKSALYVVKSGPEFDSLSFEYNAKLGGSDLTPVDRAQLEEEFRKKRESLPVSYVLGFRRTENATRMPRELMSKVLDDILSTWAAQAAERRGVLNYNVSVLSRNILPESSLESEDYIIVVDILRSKVRRALANIDQVAALPGAAVMRTGKERISLAEVRANLEDVLRFKIEPLIGLIRSAGLSKDANRTINYLENQLFQNRLEANQAAGTVRTLQESLQQYMREGQALGAQQPQVEQKGNAPPGGNLGVTALIPQFGESFLDRLTQMASQNSDVEFRQKVTQRVIDEGVKGVGLEKDTAYYTDLMGALRQSVQRGAAGTEQGEAVAAFVKAKAGEALGDLVKALDQVNALYTDLSAHNLNAPTLLYRVTAPFNLTTTRAIGLRTLVMMGVLVFIVATVLAVAGVLAYSYMRREIVDAPRADAGQPSPPAGRPAEAESPGPSVVG